MLDEKKDRQEILDLVKKYYENHKQATEFLPGKTKLSYAGRVFDHEEMVNLVDSSLDFWLTAGRYCDQFEKEFAAKLGVKYSLLVNSGSSANLVAFSALTSDLLKGRRIQKGDEVITAAAGFPTTVAPIIQFGAKPVFVDLELEDGTYNVSLESIKEAFVPGKTKAVVLAHTLGNPFAVKEIAAFCKENSIWLMEDNCDALGSTYEGNYTGTFGDIATSSFYPPHHITMGEGGAVYTDNSLLKRAAESFRDWGRDCWCPSGKDNTCNKRFGWSLGELPEAYDHKYIYRHFGYNLKVTEMQASIGIAQLKKVDSFSDSRRRNFEFFRENLEEFSGKVILPNPTKDSSPSWFGFPITLKESFKKSRKEVVSELEDLGIQTRMLFAGNMLLHPMFDSIRGDESVYRVVGDLKNSTRICNDTFWVGVFPGIDSNKAEYMLSCLRKVLGE